MDPTIHGHRVLKYSRCCLAHLQQSASGTEYVMLLLPFDTPIPGGNKHYKVWCDSTPNWIPDGFKFHSSTIPLW